MTSGSGSFFSGKSSESKVKRGESKKQLSFEKSSFLKQVQDIDSMPPIKFFSGTIS